MCGINGIIGIKEHEQLQIKITAMNTCLKHRGPDDDGNFIHNSVALGHRRLSIIDLSQAGHQPMFSENGNLVIIYNGELYNFNEIKNRLKKDYPFKTNTDTEVILAAYQYWGANCLTEFNGMFAFAIYNKTTGEVFIARDRLGVKPLYFFHNNTTFLFSSEIRSLLSTDLVPRKLNRNALSDYLRYQTVHSPFTIIQDVNTLPPGHYMKFNNGKLETKCYWNLAKSIDTSISKKNYPEIKKDVKKLFFEAVESRLISDVPFGAFLSGGIDSSAVVAAMSQLNKGKVKTFSVIFNEQEFSEAKYAQLIAKKYKTEHHELKLNVVDFINDLPAALKAMDHPSGDGPNTYVVSKATKKAGITMALSGIGGDELFAGYDVFTRTQKLATNNWITHLPSFVKKTAVEMYSKFRPGISYQRFLELVELPDWNVASSYPMSRKVIAEKQLELLLSSTPEKNTVSNLTHKIISGLSSKNHILSQVSALELATYMENVLLRDTDQMSMAHALEVREPFLDYKLVEYVLSVPDQFKTPITPKKLFVDSLGDLLPIEIVNRPKMGFTLPWKHWLKNELRHWCEQKITELSKREYFNKEYLREWWNLFLKDTPSVTWSRIWYLAVLENWLQENKVE